MSANLNLDDFDTVPESGKITAIKEQILEKYLGANIQGWRDSVTKFPKNVKTRDEKEKYLDERLKEKVLVVEFSVGEAIYNTFYTIPKTQGGYQQSNLRKVRMANDLPAEVKLWVGKDVKIGKNNKGFPTIAS